MFLGYAYLCICVLCWLMIHMGKDCWAVFMILVVGGCLFARQGFFFWIGMWYVWFKLVKLAP